MITDQEAIELKIWVVKKLEDISDADSDVLADYVLALIRADTPEPELRLNAIENLEDFLKENTAEFVDAIFLAIHSRSYMPRYAPETSTPTEKSSLPLSTLAAAQLQGSNRPVSVGETVQSRKRSYSDRPEDGDSHYGRGDRNLKQMRRAGGRSGRADALGPRGGGRGGFQHTAISPILPQGPPLGFLGTTIPPPSLPFDASDPIAAMMAMQAMGLPAFPGIPQLPQPTSPASFEPFGAQPATNSDRSNKPTSKVRCRDYDTKGYCTRGNSCPYAHGHDHIVVPGQEEYDPKNAVMMDIQRTPSNANGHGNFNGQRGNFNDRGWERGRGDRAGFVPPRRNRAEFSHSGPNHDRSITTIVVEQIPEERFDEPSVREFFSEFGKIEEVTMQPYKRLALVRYQEYVAARRAYDSPKVIFENRFVKVYWYKPNTESGVPLNGTFRKQPSVPSGAEEQAYDKEMFERDAMTAQKKLEEKKVLLRDTEAKRQALEKQRDELAQRQAEEKRKLMEKLAAKTKAKGTLPSDGKGTSNLKANGTDEGDDGKTSAQTKALRAQVAALEAEAKSLGLDTTLTDDPWLPRGRGRGRGRGSYRGWEGFSGRGVSFESPRGGSRGRGPFRGPRASGAYNLDNRTRKVGVTGVEFDAKKDEALRQYLLGIGEFEAIETVPNRTDSQIICFKDRFTAEQFMYGSKDIPSVGKLEFSWVNMSTPPIRPNPKPMTFEGNGGMRDVTTDDKITTDVDYDVAEEDDRWME